MIGGMTVSEINGKRSQAIEIFEDATFKPHKWHSNETVLETLPKAEDKDMMSTNLDQQNGKSLAKLLGLQRKI